MSEQAKVMGSVRLEEMDDGAFWRVVLATPKANVVDMEKTKQLTEIFSRARGERDLKAVLIDADGPHFSFGASVEEHLPGSFEPMIRGFHELFHRILDSGVVTIAAVRGQCLGGGLELASFCHRVFAAPDARMGQPEIMLGVFPPVASVTLVERMGRGRAEEMCLTGRSLAADEALAAGLVDVVADNPTTAAVDWAREHLLRHSAAGLRLATRAVRTGYASRFRRELAEVERLYLDDLMATHDAIEGLQAFLKKRKPVWRNE